MNLEPMARDLGALLKARGETVAVSESSTGGLVCAALLSVPGASAYFVGGAVVYTGAGRHALIGLPATLPAATPILVRALRGARGSHDPRTPRHDVGPCGDRGGRTERQSLRGTRPGTPASRCPARSIGSLPSRPAATGREANMWEFANAALGLLHEAVRAA